MSSYIHQNPTKETITKLFEAVEKFAAENAERIHDLVREPNDYPDYFYGILRRACAFSSDILAILHCSKNQFPTSIFIIGRCICDDLISINYVARSHDPKEEIYKNTADAVRQTFDKLSYLEKLNREHYDNQFEFYPTQELIDQTKTKFLQSDRNKNYLLNPDNTDTNNIQFKKYLTLKAIAEKLIEECENPKTMARVYYWWRELSAHVHFSTYALNTENERMKADGISPMYQEFGYFLFMSIKKAIAFFMNEYGYEPIDSGKLVQNI